jgi:hypothetical protein
MLLLRLRAGAGERAEHGDGESHGSNASSSLTVRLV